MLLLTYPIASIQYVFIGLHYRPIETSILIYLYSFGVELLTQDMGTVLPRYASYHVLFTECLGQHYQPTIGHELLADIRLPPDYYIGAHGPFGLCVSVDVPSVWTFVCLCVLLPTMQRYSGCMKHM